VKRSLQGFFKEVVIVLNFVKYITNYILTVSMYCFPLWEFYKMVVRILREGFFSFKIFCTCVFVPQNMFHDIQKNALNDMYGWPEMLE